MVLDIQVLAREYGGFRKTPTPFCKELLYIDLEHLFEYNYMHKQFVEFWGCKHER